MLDPLTCPTTKVTSTVRELLDDSPEQRRAHVLAQQAAELPTTADAADLLEALAR